MTMLDVATLLLALSTTTTLFYISRQAKLAGQQTRGQFVFALDEQFEKFSAITTRLLNEQTFTPVGSEWGEVWGLVRVFERINVMIEDRIFDVWLVDRLYGCYLLSIIANDSILGRLKSSEVEWQDFIELCFAVAHHRWHGVSARDTAFVQRVHKLEKKSRGIKNHRRILVPGMNKRHTNPFFGFKDT